MKMLMDRQTGEVFDTFAKAYEYAKENYDYDDDTNNDFARGRVRKTGGRSMINIIKYYYSIKAIEVYTNEIVYFVFPLNENKKLDKNLFLNHLHISILKSCCCDNLPDAKRVIQEWKGEESR